MSESNRLDRGFVNWQGQRVFVPWFGAPRIVPTAQDEVQLLKLSYRMYAIPAAYIVALCVAGVWVSADLSIGAFVLSGAALLSAIPLILGIFVVLKRRCFERWPVHSASRFSRSQFMLGYFGSLPARNRLYELCWGLLGLWIFVPALINAGEAALVNSADAWSWARLAFAGLVLGASGLATFLAARYALLASLALMPRVYELAKPAR